METGVYAGSGRGDRGQRTGAGAPTVAAPGIIGQVAPRLPIKADKKRLGKAEEIVKEEVMSIRNKPGAVEE